MASLRRHGLRVSTADERARPGRLDAAAPRDVSEKGSEVQRLIPDDARYDPITGLAQQSAVPVNVRPV